MKTVHLLRVLGLAGALAAAPSLSANCGSEPSGFGSGAAFQSWRSWCSCMGGSPPPTFNEAQRVGCRGAGSSSGGSGIGGDSVGTIIGKAAGKLLTDALFGDPEEGARRAAAAARAAEIVASEQRERDAAAAVRAAALLTEMLDVEQTQTTAPGFAGNELGLMLGDAPIPRATASGGEAIMANRAPRPPLRNPPRAVIKAPEAATPGQALVDQLLQDPPSAGAAAQVVAASATKTDSFSKGFEHGSGCYSQNAGATCSAAALEQFDGCVADYRAGFAAGEKGKKTEIGNAYRAGELARAAGAANNGAAQPGATGTCRIEWINAYSSGYSGAPPP